MWEELLICYQLAYRLLNQINKKTIMYEIYLAWTSLADRDFRTKTGLLFSDRWTFWLWYSWTSAPRYCHRWTVRTRPLTTSPRLQVMCTDRNTPSQWRCWCRSALKTTTWSTAACSTFATPNNWESRVL